MGTFGTSSDSNDTTWDLLGSFGGDGFPETQEEADRLSAFILSGFVTGGDPGDAAYYAKQCQTQVILGPVIYLLRQNLSVPRELLRRALKVVQLARKDRAYMQGWVDVDERDEALVEEILTIRRALKALS